MTKETNVMRLEALQPRIRDLLQMLSYRRPAGSKSERAFIARYLAPLGALPDEHGNHWLTVGTGSGILWSSHTDTVHKVDGPQRVLYGAGVASTAEGATDCLGADCTVGVWLMCEMAKAGIPGTYVWHCQEEVGGLGSDYVARFASDRLEGIQFAIAFDRKGQDEIITHQAGSRCASEAFASSLADVLHPLPYAASDGGTFTDTANYAHTIPECTNISVGYLRQHTSGETLDVHFAARLLDRILSADWSRLVCARDPADVDLDDFGGPWGRTDYTGRGRDEWLTDFGQMVADNPEEVADFLTRAGFSKADLEDYLWGMDDATPRRNF